MPCSQEGDCDNVIEILRIRPNSPAALAGLRTGDRIVTINALPGQSLDDVHRWLTDWNVGETLALEILRRSELMDITVAPVVAAPARRIVQ